MQDMAENYDEVEPLKEFVEIPEVPPVPLNLNLHVFLRQILCLYGLGIFGVLF